MQVFLWPIHVYIYKIIKTRPSLVLCLVLIISLSSSSLPSFLRCQGVLRCLYFVVPPVASGIQILLLQNAILIRTNYTLTCLTISVPSGAPNVLIRCAFGQLFKALSTNPGVKCGGPHSCLLVQLTNCKHSS